MKRDIIDLTRPPWRWSPVCPDRSNGWMRSYCLPITGVFGSLLIACSSTGLHDTAALEGEPREFYPDRYHYTVGDLILSLPMHYYEFVDRLSFADFILKEGSPRPVLQQEKYLVLPSDGLNPKRHFMLLDQRNLLIFSEHQDLESGYPAKFEVLRRTGDVEWTNVTNSVVPEWARWPKMVEFGPDDSFVVVTTESGASERLIWSQDKLQTKN